MSVLQLDAGIKEAFDVAYDNIFAFHAAQKSAEKIVENMKVSKRILNANYGGFILLLAHIYFFYS